MTSISDGFRHPLGDGFLTQPHPTSFTFASGPDGVADGFFVFEDFGDLPPTRFFGYSLGEVWVAVDTTNPIDVLAASNGTVLAVGTSSGLGTYLTIRHDLPNDIFWNGITTDHVVTVYGNLNPASVTVSQGDEILAGEQIATLSGDRLHFELRMNESFTNFFANTSSSRKPEGWTDPTDFVEAFRSLSPPSGTYPGVEAGLIYLTDADGLLWSWDGSSSERLLIGNTGISGGLTDIAVAPDGSLYGISPSNLYKVDPTSGETTLIGSLSGDLFPNTDALTDAQGFDIDDQGVGRVSSGNNLIVASVDLSTGVVTNTSGNVLTSPGSGDVWIDGDGSYFATTTSFTLLTIGPQPFSSETVIDNDFISNNEIEGLVSLARRDVDGGGRSQLIGFAGNAVYDLSEGRIALPGLEIMSFSGASITGAAIWSTATPPLPPEGPYVPTTLDLEYMARVVAYLRPGPDDVYNSVPAGYTIGSPIETANGFFAVPITSVNGEPILAIRGTASVLDVLADFDPQSIGAPQVEAAWNEVRAWLANHPSAHITGHSLGGAQAQHVAVLAALEGLSISQVATFNAPGISQDLIGAYNGTDPAQRAGSVTHFISNGDIVSMVGEGYLDGEVTYYHFSHGSFARPVTQVISAHTEQWSQQTLNDAEDFDWSVEGFNAIATTNEILSAIDFSHLVSGGNTPGYGSEYFSLLLKIAIVDIARIGTGQLDAGEIITETSADLIDSVFSDDATIPSGPFLATRLVSRGSAEELRQDVGAKLFAFLDFIELLPATAAAVQQAYAVAQGWTIEQFQSILAWGEDMWQLISGMAAEAWQAVKDWSTETWNRIASDAANLLEAAKTWTVETWQRLDDLTDAAWAVAKTWTINQWQNFSTVTSEAWNAVLNAPFDVWSGISGWFDTQLDDVVALSVGSQIKSLLGGADTIVGTLAEFSGDIITGWGDNDQLTILGAVLDWNNIEITIGSAIIDIDQDGDGQVDSRFILEGDFSNAVFELSSDQNSTTLTANGVVLSGGSFAAPAQGGSVQGTVGNDELTGSVAMDLLQGGDGDDTINALASADTIAGGDGDDVIDGGSGDDNIAAGDGNDFVDGGQGNDSIGGGLGNDTIFGGDGDDVMGAGFGDDSVSGGLGNDVVAGGAGNDTLDGGDGNDSMSGSFGNDLIDAGSRADDIGGGNGRDTINAGAGNDHVGGGEGDDSIDGGDGNDFLAGGGRDDTIDGGTGNDTINGGAGNDVMTGGADADQFVFSAFFDGEVDVITDFEDGLDSFFIRRFDPDTGVENINNGGNGLAGFVTAMNIIDTDAGAQMSVNGNTILVEGITAAQLTVEDFQFL